jgi:hypothetical protein
MSYIKLLPSFVIELFLYILYFSLLIPHQIFTLTKFRIHVIFHDHTFARNPRQHIIISLTYREEERLWPYCSRGNNSNICSWTQSFGETCCLLQGRGVLICAINCNAQVKNVATTEKLTVFTRVICALFSSLDAEKSVCVKYADFFCGGHDLGFILV